MKRPDWNSTHHAHHCAGILEAILDEHALDRFPTTESFVRLALADYHASLAREGATPPPAAKLTLLPGGKKDQG